MRPDLPWNVAGIPAEAREAARAAARREGLSVGEWLTRRILRSFSDTGEDAMSDRADWRRSEFRAAEPAPSSRRDTEEMLDRVSRSEAEASDSSRRIEEQLRNVARRLDSTERSQSESNRAMSQAASEINIATREQAQAFDQLGNHVVGLADRLERVERNESSGGLKDAVKGLHTGLSRLADQISHTANQSATQISALAHNLESVAGRLGQARQEAENTARAFDQRVAVLDERVRAVEKAAQTSTSALERALESIEARQIARKDEDADLQRHAAATAGSIARLEENIGKLEARGADPLIDKRLGNIEHNLSDIAARLDSIDRAAAESRQAAQTPAARSEPMQRAAEAPFSPLPNAGGYQPAPAFDAPPFPETDMRAAHHAPFAAQADEFLPPHAYEPASAFGGEPPFATGPNYGGDAFSGAPPADTYLSAARRSARAAAAQATAERAGHGFHWGGGQASSPAPGRTRYLLIFVIALIAIALVAGIILSQSISGISMRPTGVSALFSSQAPAPTAPRAVPSSANVLPEATPPVTAPATQLPASTAPTTANPPAGAATTMHRAATPAVLPPLQQRVVNAAPIHAVPSAPSAAPARSAPQPAAPARSAPQPAAPSVTNRTAAVPVLDRLTAAANAGNAKAELIVGLRYLDGDGVPVNEAQAAKWLERAAEAGEPVAQYRLGTLFERGRGVTADAAKATHWYQAAAMLGNRKAMHNLAVAYAEGSGTKKDYAEAARWFSKAAALGLADSQFNLAVLYERGMGVPQSLLDAYKWYAVAAAQGGDSESKTRIDALATQLSSADRAAAQHAADIFKAAPLDSRANVAPQLSDLPRG